MTAGEALPQAIEDELRLAGVELTGEAPRPVGGGCISRTLKLPARDGALLLKLGPPEDADLLSAEAEALVALRAAGAVAVPAVAASGSAESGAYLAVEWIDFGPRTADAERRLGRGLAALHGAVGDAFGWHRDNYIGRTPQPNPRGGDWVAFFRDARLGFQLELARRNGLGDDALRLGEALQRDLGAFFEDHSPQPSLLHGDLWGGNWGATADGTPWLFDPAAYYGDREADLAMTRLFGGFGPAFYRAYEESWPLPAGWERRVPLYNLYHLLNHFNLFGGAYRGQVLATLRSLAA